MGEGGCGGRCALRHVQEGCAASGRSGGSRVAEPGAKVARPCAVCGGGVRLQAPRHSLLFLADTAGCRGDRGSEVFRSFIAKG